MMPSCNCLQGVGVRVAFAGVFGLRIVGVLVCLIVSGVGSVSCSCSIVATSWWGVLVGRGVGRGCVALVVGCVAVV